MPNSLKPSHLIGRGEFTGPVSGIYHVLTAHVDNIAAAALNQRPVVWRLPWEFIVLRFHARSVSDDVTTATVDLKHDPTDFTGTSLLTAQLDLLADFTKGVTAGDNSGDTTTLVGKTRIPRDSLLYIEADTAGGTNGVEDTTFTVAGYILGHINDDEADDVSAPA